jgi:hypothetical protein
VKLHQTGQGRFIFQLGAREKHLFLELLEFYPLVPASHHRRPSAGGEPVEESSAKLLEEALAGQREQTRKQLHAMLAEPERFVGHEGEWHFSATPSETDWLLQVLNDVRVGSWIRLGSPDPKEKRRVELTPQNAPYLWAMELCGHFQGVFLGALAGTAASGPE